jgi:hypothetical protein
VAAAVSGDADLGFTFRVGKDGIVQIRHHGKLATTLRDRKARDFLQAVQAAGDADAQQLMARLTGNYKRGNERVARSHPRNRH